MSRFLNFFAIEEFYHIYNRGIEKRKIFMDYKDEHRFLMLLYTCNTEEKIHLSDFKNKSLNEILEIKRNETLVDIGAYCLMTNHFHILIREKKENGISIFMQKVLTAYTMYFNKKYNRSGALFQGTFKAKHCDDNNYLKYMFSYIHLNPVSLVQSDWKEKGINNKKEIKKYLEKYELSSYKDYLGQNRKEKSIISLENFPEYFQEKKDFELFIEDWITMSRLNLDI